ncbi:hypothetical protein CH267_13050 [Rhodococcus sp. 06-621-2]|nr:MmgE/PrpD family protein [Rhodococcus sp. 06-621-2]OZC55498.1 hypothetical protein CH267_13050 [Rhodococcus sp. 06-621-2]
MTLAYELAGFVADLEFDDIPSATVDTTVRMIVDTVGAGIYGSQGIASGLIRNEARARYSTGTSIIWGTDLAMHPAAAALVNATQSHEYELDDYVPAAKVHPGTVVVPAALAVCTAETTGRELITAVVAGYEAMIRIALAADATATRRRGWHITGLTGPFGGAAAVGKLRRQKASTVASAFGIAGSCSSGLFAFTSEGSMTKCMHAGRGAEAGLVAADLAESGFSGPTTVLDAQDGGFLDAVSDSPVPTRVTDTLGSQFQIDTATVKPYACCGSIHSSIDALLDLMRRHQLKPTDLAMITAKTSDTVLRQCGFEYRATGKPLEAKLSLQYCLAIAAIDGLVTVRQFAADRLQDSDICRLASAVRFEHDDEVEHLYPVHFAGRVAVRTTDGDEFEAFVRDPLGTPENPLTDAAIASKFIGSASPSMGDERARVLLGSLLNLADADSVSVAISGLSGPCM